VASTQTYGGAGTPVHDQSLGELVATATRDMSLLVHKEIDLAKAELAEQASRVASGSGLLGGAGFCAMLALLLASFAGAFGFADGLNIPIWAGFLCMTGVYLVVIAIITPIGIRTLKRVGPPERTQRTVKDTLDWVKHPQRTEVSANGDLPA
jgi:hypothetical protein